MLSEVEFNDLYPEVVAMLRDNCNIIMKHTDDELVAEMWYLLGLAIEDSEKLSYGTYRDFCMLSTKPSSEDLNSMIKEVLYESHD